jgi:ActR/RegA family two-component response regulator
MFDSKTILVLEDNVYAGLDLADAIEAMDGSVAGPVTTIADTLSILGSTPIGGAVIDCELADASAMAMALREQNVPIVLQASGELPEALRALDGAVCVLMRPVDSQTVVEILIVEIGKAEACTSNMLGLETKQV